MESVPITLEKSFIESIVKEPVASFEISKGSEKGDNVAGDLYRLVIHPKTNNRKIELVYKILPTNNPMLLDYALKYKIFDLEIGIYTTIAEKIKNLTSVNGFKGEEAQLPIPKFYSGVCDGKNDYLALQDERPVGFTMKNKYLGYNFDEVCLILKELARFHAFTYFLIKYEGEQFFSHDGMDSYAKGLFLNYEPEILAVRKLLYGTSMNVAAKLLEKINPNWVERIKNKIDFEKAGRIFTQIVEMTDVEIFPVIVHGDFWSNNILLKYSDDSKKPIAARFIDFQQCHRGNILLDLLYFIFTSTTAKFRQDHLYTCLNLYYQSFMDYIKRLNCPQPYNFTKGRFLDLFHNGYIPIYIYMAFAIPLQFGIPKDNEAGEAEEDGKVEELTPEKQFQEFGANMENLYLSHPVAISRLEELTKEFVELGIF